MAFPSKGLFCGESAQKPFQRLPLSLRMPYLGLTRHPAAAAACAGSSPSRPSRRPPLLIYTFSTKPSSSLIFPTLAPVGLFGRMRAHFKDLDETRRLVRVPKSSADARPPKSGLNRSSNFWTFGTSAPVGSGRSSWCQKISPG